MIDIPTFATQNKEEYGRTVVIERGGTSVGELSMCRIVTKKGTDTTMKNAYYTPSILNQVTFFSWPSLRSARPDDTTDFQSWYVGRVS